MKLIELIDKNYHDLTGVEKIILDYIVKNKYDYLEMSIDELAQATHTSKSAIVRLSKKLGFSGFSEFKFFLKFNADKTKKLEDDSQTLLYRDIAETIKYLKSVDFSAFTNIVSESKHIFAFGTGHGEDLSMNDLARNFMTSHILITVFPSITELYWNFDLIDENSVLIVCSYSGSNPDLLAAIQRVKANGAKIISITPMWTSPLAKLSDLSYYYVETPLNIDDSSYKEFNFYATLNIVIDTMYRSYLDKDKK